MSVCFDCGFIMCWCIGRVVSLRVYVCDCACVVCDLLCDVECFALGVFVLCLCASLRVLL